MRIAAFSIVTIATVLMAVSARAQTYDPNHPVCLQTYGIGGSYIDCGYASQAQCALSASGRASACGTPRSTASPYLLKILST
jgi:hypothetical protein